MSVDGPWQGGPFGAYATCVLAPNPGPMTLDGTNTWLLSAPGSAEVVVVDPGPDDAGHRATVHAAARDGGRRVVLTLLTHGHPDHAEGAAAYARLSGAPTLGAGYGGLVDGASYGPADLGLRAVAVPGHTADSVALVVDADALLLTGDTVLGRGTSVVAHPDGELAAYLDSLARLREVVSEAGIRAILPGHGPVVSDPAGLLAAYLTHRHERLAQVRRVLARVDLADPVRRDPRSEVLVEAVVEAVYADVPREVWPAARQSVRAQLDYLAAHG